MISDYLNLRLFEILYISRNYIEIDCFINSTSINIELKKFDPSLNALIRKNISRLYPLPRITTIFMFGSNSNFFLSLDINISRLRPRITPSFSHISFCNRVLSIISLGDKANMKSTRVSVTVKSIVFPLKISLRFFASNKAKPKVTVLVLGMSSSDLRCLGVE